MREIKFRGFDPVNKEMRFADIYETDEMSEWITWDEPKNSPQNRGLHFEIMQFTGLQDKNGVDIYEGDITKSVSEILRPFDRSVKTRTGEYVTKYRAVDYQPENSRFGFVGKEYTSISQKHATKWLEVVGNIHSNPELLEK